MQNPEIGSALLERPFGQESARISDEIGQTASKLFNQSFVSLLDERDVARRLGCSDYTIKRLRKTGQLPFLRIGRLIKFREEDLADYISRSVQRPVAA